MRWTRRSVGSGIPIIHQMLGTAWIASNGKIVTAAHVYSDCIPSTTLLEFNVPISQGDGTMNHPFPKDQYVYLGVQAFGTGDFGNDWAIIYVNPNSETGLYPIQEQQAFYDVEQNNNATTFNVIGYGDPLVH